MVAASYCSTTLAGMRPRALTATPCSFAHVRIPPLRSRLDTVRPGRRRCPRPALRAGDIQRFRPPEQPGNLCQPVLSPSLAPPRAPGPGRAEMPVILAWIGLGNHDAGAAASSLGIGPLNGQRAIPGPWHRTAASNRQPASAPFPTCLPPSVQNSVSASAASHARLNSGVVSPSAWQVLAFGPSRHGRVKRLVQRNLAWPRPRTGQARSPLTTLMIVSAAQPGLAAPVMTRRRCG